MKLKNLLITFFTTVLAASNLIAHCQIPCGIYDDDARFVAMKEDVTTLRKSVSSIQEILSGEEKQTNQLVRWIMNKEAHADRISETVLTYFLAQRIKKGQDHYLDKLEALHAIIVAAMKVKQNDSMEHVDRLEKAILVFEGLYTHHH